ncbi:hypothetical protein ADL00_12450 [Streptomyces sp. AS58]|nr:hypothetical protein ADL00_12450 [Streptomyces sp. AS58]
MDGHHQRDDGYEAECRSASRMVCGLNRRGGTSGGKIIGMVIGGFGLSPGDVRCIALVDFPHTGGDQVLDALEAVPVGSFDTECQ